MLSHFNSLYYRAIVALEWLLMPFLVLLYMIPALIPGQANESKPETLKRLSTQDIEGIINACVAQHADKVDIFKEKDDYEGLLITLSGASAPANEITLQIAKGIDLFVGVNNYWVGFDYDDHDDYHPLNEEILKKILTAYLNGEYYIKEWYLADRLIDGHLFIDLGEGKNLTNYYDAKKTVRRFFAKSHLIKFQPLV